MTSVSDRRRRRRRRRRFSASDQSAAVLAVRTHADAFALVALFLLVTVVAALTWGSWGDLDSDTGYDVQAGARIADGQLPYRDFLYYYGPLAPALSAAAALIGGSGFGPAVVSGFLITLAIVGCDICRSTACSSDPSERSWQRRSRLRSPSSPMTSTTSCRTRKRNARHASVARVAPCSVASCHSSGDVERAWDRVRPRPAAPHEAGAGPSGRDCDGRLARSAPSDGNGVAS